MDINIARHLIRVAFRNSRELSALLPLLKTNCDPSEYTDLAMGIAAAIDGVNVALINKAVAVYPELEIEMDATIAKYDRYL
jgi:hypothetical protein